MTDTIPPTLVPPEDTVVSCSNLPPVPSLTASDNCGDPTVNYNEKTESGSCSSVYTLVRSWNVIDIKGNTMTYTQRIVVEDHDAPSFALTPDTTIHAECDNVPAQITLTAVDTCDGTVGVIPSEETIPGINSHHYLLVRKWTTTDDCGNSAFVLQTVSVEDNTPPILHDVPNDESYECDAVPTTHTVRATDNCDDDVTLSEKKVFSGIECTNTVTFTYTLVDLSGHTTKKSFSIPVYDTTPPVFNVPVSVTVDCAEVPTPPVINLDDNCFHLTEHAILEEKRQDGPGEHEYTLIRIWTGADTCGNDAIDVQTIVVQDKLAPTFLNVPVDQTYSCDDTALPIVEHVSAVDNCDIVSVTEDSYTVDMLCADSYSIVKVWSSTDQLRNTAEIHQTITFEDTVSPVLLNLPSETVNILCGQTPTTPLLTATDNCDPMVDVLMTKTQELMSNEKVLVLTTWTATDNCGLTDSFTQSMTADDMVPPVLEGEAPDDTTVMCNELPIAPTISATDNCDDIIVKIIDVQVNGNCVHDFQIIRTWRAEDLAYNWVEVAQTITSQDNNDPTLTVGADETAECDAIPQPPTPTVSDVCDHMDPTVEFVEETIDGSNSNTYRLIRTWTATDQCGHSISKSQTVSVSDTTPPVVSGMESTIIEVPNLPTPEEGQASDNCDQSFPKQVPCSETKKPGSCPDAYIMEYDCVGIDLSGNEGHYIYSIAVQDTTAPEIVGVPGHLTTEFNLKIPFSKATSGIHAFDNSGQDIEVIVTEIKIEETSPTDYVLVRTFTATDLCGNKAQELQTITLVDNSPPCFNEQPDHSTVECDNIPPSCEIFTVDEELNVLFTEIEGKDSQGHKVLYRKWEAIDNSANQNKAEYIQTITIIDSTPPVFTSLPTSVTVQCNCDKPEPSQVAVIDNCDTDITISFSESKVAQLSPDEYHLEYTWRASDKAGNKIEHLQVITVIDSEPPVFFLTPNDAEVFCDDLPPIRSNYVKDNCDTTVELIFTESIVPGSCPNAYTIHRKWSATDRSGNQFSHTQKVVVKDTYPPTYIPPKEKCFLPSANFKLMAVQEIFDPSDDCATDVPITIFACNSTQQTEEGLFSSDCHFDNDQSQLHMMLDRDEGDIEGRYYSVYANIVDLCGNTATVRRNFWIAPNRAGALALGKICDEDS